MAIDISNRRDGPIRRVAIPSQRKKGLTSDILKLIAVIAMVIDHIAWAFIPFNSIAGQIMHVIGRLTAPIMCFMIAEGYYKTNNVKKYAQRQTSPHPAENRNNFCKKHDNSSYLSSLYVRRLGWDCRCMDFDFRKQTLFQKNSNAVFLCFYSNYNRFKYNIQRSFRLLVQ